MLHSLSVTWFSCDYPALSPFTLKVLPTLWVGKTKMCGAHCNTRLTSFLTVSLLSLLRPSFLASCTDSFITDSWKFSLISFLSDTSCLVLSSPQTSPRVSLCITLPPEISNLISVSLKWWSFPPLDFCINSYLIFPLFSPYLSIMLSNSFPLECFHFYHRCYFFPEVFPNTSLDLFL